MPRIQIAAAVAVRDRDKVDTLGDSAEQAGDIGAHGFRLALAPLVFTEGLRF
jgi:hypothetical protein